VAICTPPSAHYDVARLALDRRRHVLLEKPPCSSVAQLEHLAHLATDRGRTLFTTWHSQYAQAVAAAERLLVPRTLREARVTWAEDVRDWHPGQAWLREAGGFGVFDAGINALSILTRLIPEPIFARSARFHVPGNWAVPVSAEVELETARGARISVTLDFRWAGPPKWEIELLTDEGPMKLVDGGAALAVDDNRVSNPEGSLRGEYAAMYLHFVELIARGESDVDARPLQCVADIHLIARHVPAQPVEY
jgi:predicted dehydrogenase